MKKNKRILGIGALAGMGLLAAGTAQAYNMNLGGFDIQIDTTATVGMSLRVEDRETALLPAGNGGPSDTTVGVDLIMLGAAAAQAAAGNAAAAANLAGISASCGTASNLGAYALTYGSHCIFNNQANGTVVEQYNFDSAINADDGRLNFDNGDLTAGTFKTTVDIEARNGPFTIFGRVNAFYDAVMDDAGSFERSEPTSSGYDDYVRNVNLLDLYLDYNGEIGDMPLQVRLGRQVINWGEATFFIGGNSVFSPIDVGALRRPGSEIKEALLPVEAVKFSIGLPYDLNLEGYYGGWDKFKIDAGGGPFANSDAFRPGSGAQPDQIYVGSGRFSGSNRRNCDAATASNVMTAAYGALFDSYFGTCDATSTASFNVGNETGFVERDRQSYMSTVQSGTFAGQTLGDENFGVRDGDIDETGENYGLALRWYAENLNSTEFGFYYQNYTSRIPYYSTMGKAPSARLNTTAPNDSTTNRGASLQGCFVSAAVNAGGGVASFNRTAGAPNLATGGTNGRGVAELDNVMVDDPTGMNIQVRAMWDAELASALAGGASPLIDAAASGLQGQVDANGSPWDLAASKNFVIGALMNRANLTTGSVADGNEIGCAAALGAATAGTLLPSGATISSMGYGFNAIAEYPEDIEVYGVSFNSTVAGWGVQGEVSFRPDMPLQLDTDLVTIAALSQSCAWEPAQGVSELYYNLQLTNTTCGEYELFSGYATEEVWNYDIGTTATFTQSHPVISALGADIGILLTEVGVVVAPDIDKYTVSNAQALATKTPRLANKCTSGSDLPLGGVFALDPRGPLLANNTLDNSQRTTMCRPTEVSSGFLVLAQLQYNNAFRTPITLKPTFVYSTGLNGRSPSPAGSFSEDQYRMAVSVDAEYQSVWKASLGYTMYGGDVLYNRDIDRDTVSASLSYAF